MSDREPDLFSWSPSPPPQEPAMLTDAKEAPSGAIILPFPQARNIGRVRHVATKFLERDGKPRDAYWRRIVENMVGQMQRAGLSPSQIEAQVQGFTRAVQAEIDLRCFYRGSQQPGGAA